MHRALFFSSGACLCSPFENHWRRCRSRGTNPPIFDLELVSLKIILNSSPNLRDWSTHGGRASISSWAATRESQWVKRVAGLGTAGLLCGAWVGPISMLQWQYVKMISCIFSFHATSAHPHTQCQPSKFWIEYLLEAGPLVSSAKLWFMWAYAAIFWSNSISF